MLMSCGFNALLHSLGQLAQLLNLSQVLICLLALFLQRKAKGWIMRGRITFGPKLLCTVVPMKWFGGAAQAGALIPLAHSMYLEHTQSPQIPSHISP